MPSTTSPSCYWRSVLKTDQVGGSAHGGGWQGSFPDSSSPRRVPPPREGSKKPKGWFKSFDGGYACRSHTGRPTSARSACQGRRDSCGDRQSDGSMTKDSMTSSIRMLPSYLSKRLQVAARHGPQKSLTNAAHFGDRCVLLFAHSCGMRRISQEMSWWRSDRRMGRRLRQFLPQDDSGNTRPSFSRFDAWHRWRPLTICR
jgi:hypothetical protein